MGFPQVDHRTPPWTGRSVVAATNSSPAPATQGVPPMIRRGQAPVMFRDSPERWSWLAVLVYLSCAPPVSAGDTETDLNGFRLQQLKPAIVAALGKPFREFDRNGFRIEAHRIDEAAYMVFEYYKETPNHVHSIQLTGSTTRALPFKGLSLGASSTDVNRVLGTPSHVTQIERPRVTELNYEGKNYSVEIDDKGLLYSIKIHTTRDLVSARGDPDSNWQELKSALARRDVKGLVEFLRPDVEIYRDGKVISINGRFSDFLANPDEEIVAALIADKGSVRDALSQEEPEAELRLIEKFGMGNVYKFRKSRILKEIVLFPYAGRQRVYEIAFR